VRLHGRLADGELAADLRIGQTDRDQPQDLAFSLRQFAKFFRRGLNTLIMVALRRRRELALLRLVGATTRQVRSMAR
jgi:hypothetical protein